MQAAIRTGLPAQDWDAAPRIESDGLMRLDCAVGEFERRDVA